MGTMTSLGKRRVLGDADLLVGLNMDQKEKKECYKMGCCTHPIFICDFKLAMTEG